MNLHMDKMKEKFPVIMRWNYNLTIRPVVMAVYEVNLDT